MKVRRCSFSREELFISLCSSSNNNIINKKYLIVILHTFNVYFQIEIESINIKVFCF